MRENRKNSPKRKISPYATDTTLEMKRSPNSDSEIIAAPEYVWSIEYAERGGVPDVYVNSSRMLGEMQDLKYAKVNALMNMARARKAEDPEGTLFDLQKLEKSLVETVKLPVEEVLKTEEEQDTLLKETRKQKEAMLKMHAQSLPIFGEPGSPFAGAVAAPQEALASGVRPNIRPEGEITAPF